LTGPGTIFEGYWDREVDYAPGYPGPFASQLRFHNSPSRFRGFSGPVGSGKSRGLCHEALRLAYRNPGCWGLIGAPTYPMLRDATRAAMLEILEDNEIPYHFNRNENSIYVEEPESMILFRALDHFERLRGTNLAWFGIDELTYCKPEAWLRLEARLRDPKACDLRGFAVWTPKGFDWVYSRFIGPDKRSGYEAILAAPGENIALPPEFYESLRQSYDERFYKQEALGEYLNVFAGQAYYAFDRTTHVRWVPHKASYPLWWALDFNVNPMCSVIGQTINGVLYILDELVLPNSNTLAACEEFLDRTKGLAGNPLNVYVYGDASGGGRDSAASRTDWQIVREFFGRYPDRFSASFRVPSVNGLVKDRVNCVNAMLTNYAGEHRIYLHTACKELAKDFEQLAWKMDPNGNSISDLDKSDPMRSHLSDALGYYVEGVPNET